MFLNGDGFDLGIAKDDFDFDLSIIAFAFGIVSAGLEGQFGAVCLCGGLRGGLCSCRGGGQLPAGA